MHFTHLEQPVPATPHAPRGAVGSHLLRLVHSEGSLATRADMLLPHRKDYYQLVFVRRGGSRHWVDMVPYVLKDNTFYFTVPQQVQVKEEFKPFWGTSLAFTSEFLALQENAALRNLPLIQNLQHGHELLLTAADVAFVEDMLAKLETEYHRPGEWQQRMLSACLDVLLVYLSRLYSDQFSGTESAADGYLLQRFQAKVEASFRESHEVSAYADLLHISARHLSEVVKAQSGKSASIHIQERLVLEARRLLLHTPLSIKEIAFDLGFADASYFNRFFKRGTGTPPTTYRSSMRKMYP